MKQSIQRYLLLVPFVCTILTLLPVNNNYAHARDAGKSTPPVAEQPNQENVTGPASFADLAERLTPTVVNISSTQKVPEVKDIPNIPQFPPGSPFQDFFEEFMNRRGQGMPFAPPSMMGSGFIIDANNGYIITNNHVVKDADEVRVIFSNNSSTKAEIVGVDKETDIAVLKVDTKSLNFKLTAAKFGDSDVIRVGDWVMAIGNPYGLGGTVTTGIVSALARDINSGKYDDYIQTDASINRGNSGGPMFNMKGEVIGINTAIFSPTGGSIGIGFSIPSARARPVINQLIKYGHTRRGWLGVKIQTVTKEIADSLGFDKPRGALVVIVNPGSPADKAGIRGGDIITKFNNQEVTGMRLLPRLVAETEINSTADVEYWRDGKIYHTKVVVGYLEQAEKEGLINGAVPEKTFIADSTLIESVGISVKPVNMQLRDKYNIPANVKGIVIVNVEDLSEAADKGLSAGDVIVEVNQQPISKPQHLIDVIKKAQLSGRTSVLLLVNRGGEVRFVALRIPSSE